VKCTADTTCPPGSQATAGGGRKQMQASILILRITTRYQPQKQCRDPRAPSLPFPCLQASGSFFHSLPFTRISPALYCLPCSQGCPPPHSQVLTSDGHQGAAVLCIRGSSILPSFSGSFWKSLRAGEKRGKEKRETKTGEGMKPKGEPGSPDRGGVLGNQLCPHLGKSFMISFAPTLSSHSLIQESFKTIHL
jgi:hypothetical protein